MISVITPCKNIVSDGREVFFRKMMETLHTQSYQDFEHIIVDGASTDGTLDLLGEYQEKGWINTLISEPDKNVYEAMNKGVRLANGEYVHIMNTDDYFANDDFFKTSLQKLEETQADFSHGDKDILNKQGEFVSIKKGDEKSAFFRMPFRHQTMLVKKGVFNEIGEFDEKYSIASDYKFVLKMLLANKKGHYISQVFVSSREGGLSSNRPKVIGEVAQVLYECYGEKYSLTLEDCKSIYLRDISSSLFSKIKSKVTDSRILDSLTCCYEQKSESREIKRPLR